MTSRASRPPRWPWRWLVTDLLPLAAVVTAATLLLGFLWRRTTGAAAPWAALAALALLAAYVRQVAALARVVRAEEPETPPARHLLRCLRSVVLRAALFLLVLLVARRPVLLALPLAVGGSLAVGIVQIARQLAMIDSVGDEEFG